MTTQYYELKNSSEISDSIVINPFSNSNFDHQTSHRIETQSTTTSNSCLNLKFVKKMKQYPVRSTIVAVVIVIVLAISITSILLFDNKKNTVDTVITNDNTTKTTTTTIPKTTTTTSSSTSAASTLSTSTADTTSTSLITTSISTTRTTSSCNKFLTEITYSTGAGSDPYSVTAADVDGDRKIDIIVANKRTNNIGIFLN
ncbi:unnamed protein product, partial [Adineta steineri]